MNIFSENNPCRTLDQRGVGLAALLADLGLNAGQAARVVKKSPSSVANALRDGRGAAVVVDRLIKCVVEHDDTLANLIAKAEAIDAPPGVDVYRLAANLLVNNRLTPRNVIDHFQRNAKWRLLRLVDDGVVADVDTFELIINAVSGRLPSIFNQVAVAAWLLAATDELSDDAVQRLVVTMRTESTERECISVDAARERLGSGDTATNQLVNRLAAADWATIDQLVGSLDATKLRLLASERGQAMLETAIKKALRDRASSELPLEFKLDEPPQVVKPNRSTAAAPVLRCVSDLMVDRGCAR